MNAKDLCLLFLLVLCITNRPQHTFSLNLNRVLEFSIKQEGLFLYLHQTLRPDLLDSLSQEIYILLTKKVRFGGKAIFPGFLGSGAAGTPTWTSNSKVYPALGFPKLSSLLMQLYVLSLCQLGQLLFILQNPVMGYLSLLWSCHHWQLQSPES